MRRLYVSHGETPVYFVDNSIPEASMRHANARPATDDDVRAWWQKERLDTLSTSEICARFQISRQTLTLWRRRAGVQRPARPVPDIATFGVRVAGGEPVEEVARDAGLSVSVFRRKLRQAGVEIPRRPLELTDEKLLSLAAGRSWDELSAVTNRHVATLQRRVYNSAIADKVRSVMLRSNAKERKGKSRVE